jgi:hypothetical protein
MPLAKTLQPDRVLSTSIGQYHGYLSSGGPLHGIDGMATGVNILRAAYKLGFSLRLSAPPNLSPAESVSTRWTGERTSHGETDTLR